MFLFLLIIWDNGVKWKEFFLYLLKLGCVESKFFDFEEKRKIKIRMRVYFFLGLVFLISKGIYLR